MANNTLKGTNHFNRGSRRWGGWSSSQLYVTAGSLALKDHYRRTDPPAFRAGQLIARGLVKIISLWFESGKWLYNVLYDKVVYRKQKLEEVVAIWATAYAQRSEGAVSVGRQPAPTLKLLPAPKPIIFRLSPDAI
jgi:hypothetical protein